MKELSANEERKFLPQLQSRLDTCHKTVDEIEKSLGRMDTAIHIDTTKSDIQPVPENADKEMKSQIERIEDDSSRLVNALNYIKENLDGLLHTYGIE